jgi:NADH-quinone oxidoreductase subunit J
MPVGALIGLVLFTELVLVLGSWTILPGASTAISAPSAAAGAVALSNTHALGQLIYTHYAYPFQVAGLILLVAMIGAIVLTLRQRTGVRRQSIAAQIARTRATAIEVRQVKPGQGI